MTTIGSTFPKSVDFKRPTTNSFAFTEMKPLPYNTRKSPRNGRLSVSAESYIQEKNNPTLKAEMEKARANLFADFSGKADSLSQLRLLRGMSQTSLASIIGTSQSHIAKIEAGLLDIKFSTASNIADALAISLDTLKPLITMQKVAEAHTKTTVSAS